MSFIRKIKRGDSIYLAEVESKRIAGKIVQKHIRYVGTEVDGETRLASSLSDASVDQVTLYGPLLILDHLAKKIGLHEILGPYGAELLSLVYAHCLDYKSVNKMAKWFERTDLNLLLGLEDLTEKRLLNALDSLESMNVEEVQQKIFERAKQKYDLSSNGLIYDVTNTYFYGKQCPLGKFGKDKEGVKGRPLIQIGLGVTRNEGVPVFHQVVDGNVHDSRMFQAALTAFRACGIADVLVVFDRGISSKKNQLDIKRLKWKVLCGLPLNDELKRLLRGCRQRSDFLQFKNRVRLNDTVFYVQTLPYSVGIVAGTLAFCFNERKQRDCKESRFDEVAEAQRLLADKKVIKDEMKKFFSGDGRLLDKKLEEDAEFDGFSCIFTTTKMSKNEMVEKYFDKDVVEKAFHSLKGVIKVRPIRHWLYNRVKAHVFICYLSYLLLSLLRMHMKAIDMSPVAALEEMESMHKVYLRDRQKGFKISRVVTLTKVQEKILRAIDKKLLLGQG